MRLPRLPSRLVVIALAALLASTGWPASAAHGADDSNIPGVTLPAGAVTGQLGGPIYDHVYSLDVLPNSVILASLTGEAGTDFDLYLFDSSATTVYSPQGQVAQSVGSTSTESITYPTPGGGRFYLDLNGASDVQGAFRLTVSVLRDTVSPIATLELNGGRPATNAETVTVVLVGTDNLSGVDTMQLSTDGFLWGLLTDYTPTFLWTFPSGDGPKELWARVHDRAGNVSGTAHAVVTLDTVSPRVVQRDPEPSGFAMGFRPTLSVGFDEALQPESWTNNGLVVQRADSSVVAGAYGWDASLRTGTFVPTAPLVAGERLTVALGGVTDIAGNPVVPIGSWVVTVLAEHAVTLNASPAVVTAGDTARITGRVDTPVPAEMTLEASVAGGAWTVLAPLDPDGGGAFASTVTVAANTLYRVRIGQSLTEAESVSTAVRILARRGVVLAGLNPAVVRTAAVGKTITVAAAVAPSVPTVVVTLVVSRYDTARKAWVTVTTIRRSTVAGRASFSWRPTARGSWIARASTPSSVAFTNATSPIYRWTVT